MIDPLYPPITADTGGVAADTAPNRMWLGGLTSGSDSAVQTVTIPAGTTALVLRGKYDVRTSETGGVYDTAAVEMLSSADAVLETAMSLTNQGALTAWTNFTFTFATPHAGQTVKIRFRSTNDLSLETSFFFDSLALDATVCQ